MELKVLTACGNGMGCCQLIAIKMDKVFKKLGVRAKIDHTSVGIGKTSAANYDVVFCSTALVSAFSEAQKKGTIVVGLKNLTSEEEMEQKVVQMVLGSEKVVGARQSGEKTTREGDNDETTYASSRT